MSPSGKVRGSARRGITLADVLVVLFIVAVLLFAILPATVGRTGESSGRVKCASNLRQIGQGIQMYANENKGNFPRARYDGLGGTPTEYTLPQCADPFAPGGPGPNDVTAALFLLLRTQDLTSEVFVCPSTQAERWDFGGQPVTAVSNFPSRKYLTYSYINPYPAPAVVAKGFKLNYTLTSDFAVAADMNPGAPAVVSVTPNSTRQQMMPANSRNHNGDGQNVLYADGHVEFQNTPFCGMPRNPAKPGAYRDNIYTFGAGFGGAAGVGVKGPHADAEDSVLLPSEPDGPAVALGTLANFAGDTGAAGWMMVAVGAAVMFGVVAMLLALVRRTNAPTSAPGGTPAGPGIPPSTTPPAIPPA
jgi:prepilin-type processing-associated H-X9-DG protein